MPNLAFITLARVCPRTSILVSLELVGIHLEFSWSSLTSLPLFEFKKTQIKICRFSQNTLIWYGEIIRRYSFERSSIFRKWNSQFMKNSRGFRIKRGKVDIMSTKLQKNYPYLIVYNFKISRRLNGDRNFRC